MENNAASPKVALMERMVALLFSDDMQLSEEERDGICRYLADREPGLLEDILYRYFASRPDVERQEVTAERSALVARKWAEIAPELGMNPDIGYYKAARRAAVRRRLWRRGAFRAAAVLIPAALIVGGYFGWERWSGADTGDGMDAAAFVATYTVSSPRDSIRRITLADGTEVTLNRSSTFSCNDSREGELSGEAWFMVAPDAEGKPFVIRSGEVTVTVVGTEFNLRARAEEETTTLSLYEGRVRLDSPAGTHSLDGGGREFSFDRATSQADIHDFDATARPAWLTVEKELFSIMPLGAIFDLIESAYGLTIEGRGNIEMDKRYNFALDTALDAEAVMSSLEFLHGGFGYTIDGDRVMLVKK